MTDNYLKNISIVLVNTKTSANIGATARAMNCMGLKDLILVAPRCQIDRNAFNLAVGSEEILQNTQIYYDLNEALKGFSLTVGTTHKKGKKRHNFITPRLFAGSLLSKYKGVKTAILFGSEDYGLSIECLKECQYLIYIPVSEEFGSLNLAQAVMVITYELRANFCEKMPLIDESMEREELSLLSNVFSETFKKIRFPAKRHSLNPAAKLSEICARADLTKYEVKLLLSLARHANYMSDKLWSEND